MEWSPVAYLEAPGKALKEVDNEVSVGVTCEERAKNLYSHRCVRAANGWWGEEERKGGR